jgi:hypothetical protein
MLLGLVSVNSAAAATADALDTCECQTVLCRGADRRKIIFTQSDNLSKHFGHWRQ